MPEQSGQYNLKDKTVLLVIAGGIAAYKALELIRLIRRAGGRVRCILTKGGSQFVTPLSVSALCEEPVYTDLWSLKDEAEMGHIRLSRGADLIVIAPASANLIAKMAHGLADDLASTTLLAADKPIVMAPAMNHMMWHNPATQDNLRTLAARGIRTVGPVTGDMACGEHGMGRMAEPEEIFRYIEEKMFGCLEEWMPEDSRHQNIQESKHLKGLSALVTSGPTYEPLDPVRFIGNRSSGKQGHAVAAALAAQGAAVTLVTGPVTLPDPPGVKTLHVETAVEMLDAARKALPADIAVCAAAVSDWSAAAVMTQKIKKRGDRTPPDIKLKENPDILAALAGMSSNRPPLVIGFAAETDNLLESAREKRTVKSCDWIVANQVGGPESPFASDENHVYLVTAQGAEEWPRASKQAIADRLATRIAAHFDSGEQDRPIAAE